MTAIDKNIYKDNQYEPEFDLTKKLPADGSRVPAAGYPGMSMFLAATKGGATIHASLTVAATERPSKLGSFYALYPPSLFNALLFPAYDGKDIYVHLVSADGKVKVYDRVKAFSVRPSA